MNNPDKQNKEGKIIAFKSNLYIEQINLTKEHIEEFAKQMYEDAINIAIRWKWQKWNESMKVGDVCRFSEDMLWTTDDLNIHAVLNIKDTILEMLKKIK